MSASYHSGSGSPLVLLHGATGSWRMWEPTLHRLSQRHEVFALTMIGHRGGAPLGIDPHLITATTFVDDVERQLDALGLDTAHLVGNSLGGRVGLELLRRGRARSVTVFSPAAAQTSPADGQRLESMFRQMLGFSRLPGLRWLTRRSAAARRVLSRRAMERGDLMTVSQVDALFDDLRVARPWVLALVRNSLREGNLAAIERRSVPVCIAWGSHDRVIPFHAHGAPLAGLVPGAQFVRLPGCGHVPVWDDTDRVVELILDTAARADATNRG